MLSRAVKKQYVAMLTEEAENASASCAAQCRARLACRLQKALLSFSILQLHRPDPSKVEQIPAVLLVAARRLRPLALRPQLVCLIIQAVMQVVAQQHIEQDLLAELVVVEHGGAVQLKQRCAHGLQFAGFLISQGVVKVDAGGEDVHRAPVVEAQPRYKC